ncbi:MAG TPA: hypothetical protein VFS47_10015 [Steroidobacteraceae bacterium]|nr:hypothetical protein [Steroidobacteraceae bacterium]
MRSNAFRAVCAAVLVAIALSSPPVHAYDNFKVSVYCRAYEVKEMADPAWLEARWKELSSQVHVDKVYLETHRDLLIVDDKTIEAAKAFFAKHGVKTAGGITFTIDESNRFETFSYSNPEHRRKVQEIVEHTARHFDEFILDDFFFTSAKSEYDWKAKGDRTWTQYRLQLMVDAARDLVVGPAKKVNPNVKVVIKYPNWYDHFQGLGFNLEKEPAIFDGIYTGTETRDAVLADQHLQPYLSYNIMRYFSNIAPGRNGGGWVDTGGARYYDRYAEQLWLTLFAKAAPEITLFDIRQMHYPLDQQHRAPWQDQPTSFDYEDLLKPLANGAKPTSYARVAGVSFEAVDKVLGALGRPIGLKSYKPFHSGGEAFLQNYLGMVGLPMEMVTSFPENDPIVLLTAQAADDARIVEKIEKHVHAGNTVVITSGLLKALQGRGIEHIAEIEDTGRVALVKDFKTGRRFNLIEGDKPILIPQIGYKTNDSWELVSAVDGDNGWPLLHDADYIDGQLQVLTIPENFADLYHYPEPVLNAIRRIITKHLPVQLEAPSKVSLFLYDNGTFIVENFRDEEVKAGVSLGLKANQIQDIASGEKIGTNERKQSPGWGKPEVPVAKIAAFTIPPHSFRAFRVQ